MKGVTRAFQTVSRLLAATSVFFIAHDISMFGLSTAFTAFLQFWDMYIREITIRIADLFMIRIGDQLADFIALYIALGFCNIRRYARNNIIKGFKVTAQGKKRPADIGFQEALAYTAAFFLLWPLAVLFAIILPFILKRGGISIGEQLGNQYYGVYIHAVVVFIEEVFFVLIAFLLLFVFNYAFI